MRYPTRIGLHLSSLFFLFLCGCTMSGVVPTSQEVLPPRSPSTVKLLFAEPIRPYDQIAIVHSSGGSGASESQLYRKLQATAAKVGADAVIVGQKDAGFWHGKNLSGSAIKFQK